MGWVNYMHPFYLLYLPITVIPGDLLLTGTIVNKMFGAPPQMGFIYLFGFLLSFGKISCSRSYKQDLFLIIYITITAISVYF